MSYNPYTWRDDIDAIDAIKLNHMEQGISKNSEEIDELKTKTGEGTFEPDADGNWHFDKAEDIHILSENELSLEADYIRNYVESEYELIGGESSTSTFRHGDTRTVMDVDGIHTSGDIADSKGTLDEVREKVDGISGFEKLSGDPDDYWVFEQEEAIQIDSTKNDLTLRGNGYIYITDRLSGLSMKIDGYLKKFSFLAELGKSIVEITKGKLKVDGDIEDSKGTLDSVRQSVDNAIENVYGTSDMWASKTSWAKDEICIDENKLWKCLISNSNKPSEGTEWTQISLKNVNSGFYSGLTASYSNMTAFTNNSFYSNGVLHIRGFFKLSGTLNDANALFNVLNVAKIRADGYMIDKYGDTTEVYMVENTNVIKINVGSPKTTHTNWYFINMDVYVGNI